MPSPTTWLTLLAIAYALISAAAPHSEYRAEGKQRLLALIPMPRIIALRTRCDLRLAKSRTLRIAPSADAAGREILGDRLRAIGIRTASTKPNMFSIRRLRGQPESYTLDVDRSRISISAADGAGEMYAFATLAQLVDVHGIPCVHVSDRPAMPWRFVSDDVSRGPLPTMAYFAYRIKRLATYKFNGYSIYLENMVRRTGHENETRADALTRSELAQLARLAAHYHMQFIPEQESFGHLGALLANDRYKDVRENANSDLISPAAPRTYQVLGNLFAAEFSGLPNVRMVHIGGDEPFELGSGRSASLVRKQGYGAVYGRHMSRVAGIVRKLGSRPIIWGDEALVHPEILTYLPRSVVIAPYWYHVERSYSDYILPLRKAGFDVVVAPSVANYSQFFPDISTATQNIAAFAADGKAARARGMLLTVWIGLRDELYDSTWYPLAFGAASAWQQKAPSNMEFCRRYALLTFGSEPACGAFSDLASLSNWFASAFPYDTPDTLLRADRRVPFLDDQIRLHARDYPQIANIVRDLQDRIILMRGPQNFHEGNAVLLAALRYEFLVKWLSGSPIDRSDIERAEHLHLAEWHYENRPLTAVDQVAQAYRMLEPTPALPHTALALPKPAPRQPAREIRQIVAWLRKKDPTTVSRRFLFGDTLAYIVHGRGVEPSQAAPYLTRANALVTSSTDPAAHVAGRYLFAVIRKAEMPVEIRREYRTLLTVHAKSNATPFTAPAYRILADLGNHEADLAALQDAVRVGLHAGAAVQALDSQQQRVRAMENCFNTYIHEWELVRRTGGSIDDERARLAPTVQRAFCSA